MLKTCFQATLVFALMAPLSQVSAADAKSAVTNLADVDEDFAFQGEYSGWILSPWNCWQSYGLQVIAMGNGQFSGVLYPGGLPGNGFYGGERTKLSGQRTDNVVQLNAEGYLLSVSDGTTTVARSDGSHLGSLTKIERTSNTMGMAPPYWAKVLFDGTNTDNLKDGKITDDGLLMVGTETKESYSDFYLHLEFRLPYMPNARGQGRANSGVYLQSRYEVQILDSFGLDGLNNECGGLYKYKEPDLNLCYPPLTWQTYDIEFHAARFDGTGNKCANAVLSVWHNGYQIHNQFQVEHKTGAGKQEGPEPFPTKLQNHGNPVNFRNIWICDYSPQQPAIASTPCGSSCSTRASSCSKHECGSNCSLTAGK